MQDLQTLEEIEKIEQSLNNIDLNETILLEATKTIKKKSTIRKTIKCFSIGKRKIKRKNKRTTNTKETGTRSN